MIKIRFVTSIVFIITFIIGCSNNEVMKIKNEKSNESIYMKYYPEWDESIVISNNRNLIPDTSIYFVVKYAQSIFYKLDNDTLTIYGGYHHSNFRLLNKFKTTVIYKEVVSYESIELYSIYESKGLSIFPKTAITYAVNFKIRNK